MVRKILLLVLLAFVSSAIPSHSADIAEFNVATYNLRQKNEIDSANGDGWHRRYPMIAQIIRFHDFHIFGTQEGFKDQLDDLKSLLPGYEYTGVAREDGNTVGEHSAIFYDTNLFELIDHGDFWLSETPDRPGLGWDAACTRICSWGKFRHKESGKTFQFFNLHLDHVGEQARIESILLVQKKMKEIGMDLPTFLTGDFNVDQTNEMYGVLAGSDFLLDAFTTADFVYAPNGTINSYKTDGYTESRIDHIFVSNGIAVEKYGVLTDTYRTPIDDNPSYTITDFPKEISLNAYRCRVPSDHFPVKIRIKLP
ncbi:MAG: endonuclease/exonuclease/phosphatase family protein [Duncaniella sp.]|nr:endonuclease/exonuclease/phosphatase family protein [Duncaniella sp.]